MASPFKFNVNSFLSQTEDSAHDIFNQFLGAPSQAEVDIGRYRSQAEADIAASQAAAEIASAQASQAQAQAAQAATAAATASAADSAGTVWWILGGAALVVVLVVMAKK